MGFDNMAIWKTTGCQNMRKLKISEILGISKSEKTKKFFHNMESQKTPEILRDTKFRFLPLTFSENMIYFIQTKNGDNKNEKNKKTNTTI